MTKLAPTRTSNEVWPQQGTSKGPLATDTNQNQNQNHNTENTGTLQLRLQLQWPLLRTRNTEDPETTREKNLEREKTEAETCTPSK